MKLTVYYEGQYWVGVVEVTVDGKLKAYRHIFGVEPKDPEILEFVNFRLLQVINGVTQALGVEDTQDLAGRINPKRLVRLAARETSARGVSSFAQEALKLDYEQRKKEKQVKSKEERERFEDFKRELKVQKAKAKHRGK
ncbi:YjdF family protein [Paenibacillus segetis]|uniref:DUF2992 domain-containing protein n=1 Tax=Paenibacillus segetis TaxID=1325360 RepID=A0ABQ1Y8L3_9BACL|nr:YjdF family protein [Paenibacillus segetis]GGH16382.1 hypothetical protein GCM10008013_11150 [Paenibacillus segetis]